MHNLEFSTLFLGFLTDVTYLAGIPLVVATAAALTVSVLQAMTQIQDQNISQTVKIVAIVVVFGVSGTSLVKPLVERTNSTFANLHVLR